MSDSISDSIDTTGRITVGSLVTGEIETANDRDAYAVELVAGRTYRIDLEGVATDKGTLVDPFLRWLRDGTGTGVAGTRDDNGGEGDNARQTFTPAESGTYYISARGQGVGTYTLTVTDTTPVTDTTTSTDATPVTDATRAGATDLGDITALAGPRFPHGTVDGSVDRVDYYRFTLTEAKRVGLGLRQQDVDADLYLEDADGTVLYRSTNSGTADEAIGETLLAGTYYVRVESQEAGLNAHVVRYGVSAPDADAVAALQQQSGTAVNAAPAFAETSYAFALAENADGSSERVSLGTVAGTDPEGETLAYALVGGNESGSFEVDAASGELFYKGSGEDFESGATRFTLTVRASDGSETADTTVTVDVTDVNETPSFAETSYAFDLAENADGSTNRVSLGTVAATDPEGATLAYSLAGGNESGSFELDAESGELFYKGAGEDFESGTTQFELTVRASDGSETVDTTVTVNVTDVNETPTFAEASYTFDLAENADGSTNRMSLGTVAATDPEGTAPAYSLVGGNESGSFEVDAASGELFYKGSGEDFESGATRFTLTVRASDGSETADTSVTVNVTDVDEAVDPPVADGEQAADRDETALQTVSEPDGEDFSADTSTGGQVVVGETATGDIGSDGDRDWFAVDLVEGRTYTIELRGSPTADGTLSDPLLYGIHDADGNLLAHTTNDDGGDGRNSKVTFTATASGTFYIAAGAYKSNLGTYEVEVTDNAADDTRADATNLGNITALQGPRFPLGTVDGDADQVDYYRFTLTEAKQVGLGLRQQDANADLFLEDANGNVLYRSTNSGTDNEVITETLLAGTYYLRVESQAAGVNAHVVRYGVSAPDADRVTALQEQSGTAVNEAPTFGQQGYTFALAENADGSTDRVTLGTVAATDPEGTTLAYSLAGGNESGSFEVDATSGELFYKGSGEDFESGTTRFTLTVRASDGSETADTTVTVDVTDVDDTPAIRVADAEATEDDDTEMVFRVTLESASTGTVTVNYATADGTATAGEDYTATSGTLTFAPGETEKTVSVAIIDDTVEDNGETFTLVLSDPSGGSLGDTEATGTIFNTDPPAIQTSVSEPAGEDLPADTTTTGAVAVGGAATGNIGTSGDRDWFAVELVAGKKYRVDVEAGNCDAILHGIHDSSGTFIAGTRDDNSGVFDNAEKVFTATDTGTHYIAAGSHFAGRFLVLVHDVTTDDFPADRSKTGSVAMGGSTMGEIETGNDRDWFAVELVAGRRYAIELRGSPTGDGTLADPALRGIHDADGNLIAHTTDANGGDGLNSRVTFTATETGTHYIAAGGGWRDQTGTYTVEVSEEPPTIRIANAQATEGDDTTIVFRVTLQSASSGTVTVNYATADGTATAGEDYTATSGTLTFAPGETEKTVSVAIIDDTAKDGGQTVLLVLGNPTGGRLWLAKSTAFGAIFDTETQTELAGQDLPADTTTTGAVAVGGTTRGNIERDGDRDWFAVELAAETSYWIRLGGRFSNVGTLDWPWLAGLYDADGNLIPGTTGHDWLYHDSRTDLFFTPDTAGTYYIAAGGADVGTYTLLVAEAEADDFSADTMTTGTVTVGGTAEGNIEAAGDRDWFGVSLVAGTSYLIDLKGNRTNDGTLADPRLAGIHDSSGDLVSGTVDDNDGHRLNAQVRFTPDTSGKYYIAADESSNYGERGGTYTLSVEEDTM